jgi:glycerophosphodiester phosphodiesterase
LWLNNTSLFSKKDNTGYKFLAHRGLAQVFDETNTDWNSNTAAMIEVPTHDYIENTILLCRLPLTWVQVLLSLI